MARRESIYRTNKRENPYLMVDRFFIEDTRLSWRAKGLMLYMLSRPDDWEFHESHLVEQAKEGRDAVRNALKELKELGYVVLVQERNEGRFGGTAWDVYERPEHPERPERPDQPLTENPSTGSPLTEKPSTEKPLTGKPPTENPPRTNKGVLLNTDSIPRNESTNGTYGTNGTTGRKQNKPRDERYAAFYQLFPDE